MRRSQTFAVGPPNAVGIVWEEGTQTTQEGAATAAAAAGSNVDSQAVPRAAAEHADEPPGGARGQLGVRLLTNVQAIPIVQFKRAMLATHYGIHSIALRCYREGILEMGSREHWTAMPSDADPAFRLVDADVAEAGTEAGPGAAGRPGVIARSSRLGTIPKEIALVFEQRKQLTEPQVRLLWRRYADGRDSLGHAEMQLLLEDMRESAAGAQQTRARLARLRPPGASRARALSRARSGSCDASRALSLATSRSRSLGL
jgi:hypothetical protein